MNNFDQNKLIADNEVLIVFALLAIGLFSALCVLAFYNPAGIFG